MENLSDKFNHIKGWAIDADPENEPTYPMKNYTGDDHKRLGWERPDLQPVKEEVLHSNERPYMPATFGTSLSPSGLSGIIRRFAFRYSEGSFLHWLPLLLADRINIVEGILNDFAHGRFPNFFVEWGWRSEWKHRPGRLIVKVTIGLTLTAAVIAFAYFRSKKRS
jgi:hypothetical protein